MTEPRTQAACAPVNSPAVQRASIMQAVANPRCQCTVTSPFCEILVAADRAAFKPRYG
jgi:hypothetical protein